MLKEGGRGKSRPPFLCRHAAARFRERRRKICATASGSPFSPRTLWIQVGTDQYQQPDPLPMSNGYRSENFDSIDDALDELLCEYVDGTMDPTVREAFEEYLEANPDLAHHAECLCRTREKLCAYACRHVRESLHQQIRARVAQELKRKNRSARLVSSRLGNAARITSAVSIVLILGMMVGVTAVQQMNVEGDELSIVEMEPDRSFHTATDAHANPFMTRPIPLEWSASRTRPPVLFTPVSTLPAFSQSTRMTPFHWPAFATDSLARGGLMRTSAP
jgi:hypothetical protein